MRTLPILLLVLAAGTAQSQEPEKSPIAPPAPVTGQNSALEQLNARMAELKAQIDALNSGRPFPATPAMPTIPTLPRIGQLRFPTTAPNPAASAPRPAGNCAIPLVTVKPAPGVNYTMRQYTPDVDSMAPMTQIKGEVCDSSPR